MNSITLLSAFAILVPITLDRVAGAQQCVILKDRDIHSGGQTVKSGYRSDQCCGLCSSDNNCKGFAWNSWNGGTCYLKTDVSNVVHRTGIISGILQSAGGSQRCSRLIGKDIQSGRQIVKSGYGVDQCCELCSQESSCKGFAWNSWKKGTCYLKTDVFRIVDKPGVISGVLEGQPGGDKCYSSLSWKSQNGNLVVNGNVFRLKGVSYFGAETETFSPHGLWSHPLSKFLDFIKANNFNAVRLALSVEMVLQNPPAKSVSCAANPSICKLRSMDLYEHVIDECAKRGLLVMIDQHRLRHDGGISELWYENPSYSEQNILRSWDTIMQKFGRKWNVFALDLKNEPHGRATWGNSSPATDWNKAAERIISHIARQHPYYSGLFFVAGVSQSSSSSASFWGGNIQGVHSHPIRSGVPSADERVVFTPHVYGPDVFEQSYFNDGTFPNNMPNIWREHFGFAEKTTGRAVVVGEWGGQYRPGTKDRRWADRIADYFIAECLSDQFYWCLNPNSGDTGGLLQDDWVTPRQDKLTLLRKVQPNPSELSRKGSKICFTPGSSASARC